MERTPRMDYRRDWQEKNRRNNGAKPQKIAECGTPAAYRRHLRNGEPIDAKCRDAWKRDAAERRRKAKVKAAAKGKATAKAKARDKQAAAQDEGSSAA